MEEERQGNSGGGSRPSGLCPGNKCPRLRVLVMATPGEMQVGRSFCSPGKARRVVWRSPFSAVTFVTPPKYCCFHVTFKARSKGAEAQLRPRAGTWSSFQGCQILGDPRMLWCVRVSSWGQRSRLCKVPSSFLRAGLFPSRLCLPLPLLVLQQSWSKGFGLFKRREPYSSTSGLQEKPWFHQAPCTIFKNKKTSRHGQMDAKKSQGLGWLWLREWGGMAVPWLRRCKNGCCEH